MAQTGPELCGKRAAENAFVKHLAGAVRRELYNCDARTGKPLLGIAGEEEQPDVAGRLVLVDGGGDPHPAVDHGGIGLVAERAADIMKVLAHGGFPKMFDPGLVRYAVIPRYPCGLLDQRLEPAGGLRVHGLRARSNPVFQGLPAPEPSGAR